MCTEINLMLGLMNYGEDISVDFEIVWAQGHVLAERTETSVENFFAWVNTCMNR